ncbi:MAG: hypothetical protein OEW96_01975 [Betaproteobacteria bacterium]|nr:hypothetical protein [Betaproteobacteria bacterium]MDH5210431.1 hypothetical protein [Betaproteobacteria bacterium]
MTITDMVGWLAAGLVLATFCLRSMAGLRSLAIASNLAFIAYGLLANALPIVVLHLALLPVNVVRLLELRTLAREAGRKSPETPPSGTVIPYARPRAARLAAPQSTQPHLADGGQPDAAAGHPPRSLRSAFGIRRRQL